MLCPPFKKQLSCLKEANVHNHFSTHFVQLALFQVYSTTFMDAPIVKCLWIVRCETSNKC